MDIRKEYGELKDDYIDFMNEVQRVIDKLLFRHKIQTAFNISSRLKQLDSIEEKINSRKFNVKKSISELNDLIGLRIVLLFPEFKEKVVQLLSEEFEVLHVYRKDNISVDTFGYNSVHIILRIKESWLKTPDWVEHSGKKIEIQIRTLSEHIWAETSHALFYKREENIPKVIRRDFYRLSALLEFVDEQLQNIKEEVTKHFDFIKNSPYDEILRLDLNPETFKRVMSENSNGIYDLTDHDNKILSANIEHDYDIFNALAFHDIIHGKIDLTKVTQQSFIEEVIKLLEIEKERSLNQIANRQAEMGAA